MITHFKALGGYCRELPAVGDKLFDFNPGLNALFGPNGCGKSTILKCIKAYCGIKDAGWTKLSTGKLLPATAPNHFPYVYRVFTPPSNNKRDADENSLFCDCLVTWDGTPTFYNDSEIKIDSLSALFRPEELNTDGLTTADDQIDILKTTPSSGELRLRKLNKLLSLIQNPPNLSIVRGDKVTELEKAYISSLKRLGKTTLLLDEPEKALSLPKQLELFNILIEISKTYQVIIATHSPFILFLQGVNIIDMETGYSALCQDLFHKCVN